MFRWESTSSIVYRLCGHRNSKSVWLCDFKCLPRKLNRKKKSNKHKLKRQFMTKVIMDIINIFYIVCLKHGKWSDSTHILHTAIIINWIYRVTNTQTHRHTKSNRYEILHIHLEKIYTYNLQIDIQPKDRFYAQGANQH